MPIIQPQALTRRLADVVSSVMFSVIISNVTKTEMEETLEDLLEWQKQERPDDKLVFMEIFTDGTACCQTGRDFEIHIEGDTPLEALKKTRAFLS